MKKSFTKIIYGLNNNKISTILAFGLIIPMTIILLVIEKSIDSILLTFLIVPFAYRFLGNIIIKLLIKKGFAESNEYFILMNRIVTMLIFCVVASIANYQGYIQYPFIGIISVSIAMGYFDKFFFFVLHFFSEFIAESSVYGLSDGIGSVDSLISNSRTSTKQADGTTIYQDSSGQVIGSSKYNSKTGETIYLNANMGYLGKSNKDSLGHEQYFDSKLNYTGQSVKESNGTTSYYDRHASFKGISKDNGNTTSYHK